MANAPTQFTDGIQSLTAQLGTDRDKAATLSYVADVVDDLALETAYRSSWLARKIVTIPALDAFRAWRDWQADGKQVEALEEEERRLGLLLKLVRAKTLARLYGECFVYFDLGDNASTPVNPDRVKAGGIRFVTVMTHRQLVPGDLDQDPLSPTFGDPIHYRINGGQRGDVVIHPSRLIRFLGAERPDEYGSFGTVRRADSVLLSLLPSIKQFDATAANVASLVFEAKIDVISVKGLMSIAGNPVEERRLLERYRLAAAAKSNNGMLLLDGDSEEYTQKTASFGYLTDILDRQAQNSAGGADIPATRLFSQAPAGMNATGDSDIRNYYDRIAAEQNLELRPALAVFDECLIRSALGARPADIHYKWSSLWQVSDKERADLGTAGAQTIKTIKETGLIPDPVLAKALVNLATQDGTLPGLESEYNTYFAEGGQWDLDQEEPPAEPPEEPTPSGGGHDGGDVDATLDDEQPRAPKGAPNGGQWVKSGTGAGGGGAVTKALQNTASAKYPASAILALTEKDPKALSHYEKKVLAKYKKNLENEKVFESDAKAKAAKAAGPLHPEFAKAAYGVSAPEAAAMLAEGGKQLHPEVAAVLQAKVDTHKPPAPAPGTEVKKAHLAGKAANDVDAAVKGDLAPSAALTSVQKAKEAGAISAAEEANLTGHLKAKAEEDAKAAALMAAAAHPSVAAKAQQNYNAKLAEVAALSAKPSTHAAQTTEEVDTEFESLGPDPLTSTSTSALTEAALNKVATAQYPAEKVKSLLSKDPKALTHYEKKKLAAYKKALVDTQAPPAAAKAGKPTPAEQQAVFAALAGSAPYGMQLATVEKLATGEWQPDPNKPYQKDIADKAKAYLATGVAPSVAPKKMTSTSGANSNDLKSSLATTPPPISSAAVPQTHFVTVEALSPTEKSAATKYTGSTYHAINGALRKGGTHPLVPAIDSAISKSAANQDMVLVRGVSSHGMASWMAAAGGDGIQVGSVIKDKGFVSTTRQAHVASGFAGGGTGFGLKINVPKGARILPLKSISSYAHEDEFLLPRGSAFKITGFDEKTKVITVDLVAA